LSACGECSDLQLDGWWGWERAAVRLLCSVSMANVATLTLGLAPATERGAGLICVLHSDSPGVAALEN